MQTYGVPPEEVCETDQRRREVTRQLNTSLHVDRWLMVSDMNLGDNQEIQENVDREFN